MLSITVGQSSDYMVTTGRSSVKIAITKEFPRTINNYKSLKKLNMSCWSIWSS